MTEYLDKIEKSILVDMWRKRVTDYAHALTRDLNVDDIGRIYINEYSASLIRGLDEATIDLWSSLHQENYSQDNVSSLLMAFTGKASQRSRGFQDDYFVSLAFSIKDFMDAKRSAQRAILPYSVVSV